MNLGIDVGSTFTKYVIVNPQNEILRSGKFKSPANQMEGLGKFVEKIKVEYPIRKIGACGYGRKNVPAHHRVSDLTALAEGIKYIDKQVNTDMVIDIGGQDTKVLMMKNGRMKDFALNDKCAAGAGMFIAMAMVILDMDFLELGKILERSHFNKVKPMSSICAVFSQTEIIARMAAGETREEIITAVVDSVLKRVKPLASQLFSREKSAITGIFTGGLSAIQPIDKRISEILGLNMCVPRYAEFLAAYGTVRLLDKN